MQNDFFISVYLCCKKKSCTSKKITPKAAITGFQRVTPHSVGRCHEVTEGTVRIAAPGLTNAVNMPVKLGRAMRAVRPA